MMLVEETPVPVAALPVAQFREHLRMGTGFADDALQDGLLETHLRAALAAIEARTGKILIARSFSWTVSAWHRSDCQRMPVAPVELVTTVTLIDYAGTENVVVGTAWQLTADAIQPALVGLSGALPTIPRHGRARIDFIAGYGPSWGDVPADVAQAVLMLATHFYEFRHSAERQGVDLPTTVTSLIAPYRTLRTFMGGGRS